jgi:uncharacterized membrane protein YgcG
LRIAVSLTGAKGILVSERFSGRCLIYLIRHCAVTLAVLLAASVPAVVPGGVERVVAQDQSAPPNQPVQDQSAPPEQPDEAPYAKLNESQLQRLVAPIALYPDSLVAQILGASTFPSQIVDAEDFVQSHPGLSPSDLGAQVDQQPWDPSVKALVQFPSVLENLSRNLGWTSELGDAYYNQQDDVMKAVQEMRKKAKKAGNLKTTQQLNVEDQRGQISIAPVDPDVVYVPAFNPWVVYGYPIAPWPYWVDVPGIWWDGPGIYFGVGFPIAPFFGFGWGWHAWGVDWYNRQFLFNRAPFYARGPAFFNRGAYYGGHLDMARPGGYRGWLGGRDSYRGFEAPGGGGGVHSGPFTGMDHGGLSRGFSARGQESFGGFHGGGFGGGGFHGGGGGRR